MTTPSKAQEAQKRIEEFRKSLTLGEDKSEKRKDGDTKGGAG